MNLLGNAKEALTERNIAQPRITIKLVRVQDVLIASIGDNAGGVAPEHLERIFDPYFSTKGNLFVQNEGEGAKFSVILHTLEA